MISHALAGPNTEWYDHSVSQLLSLPFRKKVLERSWVLQLNEKKGDIYILVWSIAKRKDLAGLLTSTSLSLLRKE